MNILKLTCGNILIMHSCAASTCLFHADTLVENFTGRNVCRNTSFYDTECKQKFYIYI